MNAPHDARATVPVDGLCTTEQAALVLHVPANVIAAWKRRGRVTPRALLPGRGPHTPLYVLDELRPLAAAYHARKAATRPTTDACSTPANNCGVI